jgi:hypothetical protein
MKLIRKRCVYCGTPYRYQASGGGAGRYNHPDHCPACRKVVCKALAEVPVVYQSPGRTASGLGAKAKRRSRSRCRNTFLLGSYVVRG